jgi:hypothetical protein
VCSRLLGACYGAQVAGWVNLGGGSLAGKQSEGVDHSLRVFSHSPHSSTAPRRATISTTAPLHPTLNLLCRHHRSLVFLLSNLGETALV